MLAAKKQTDQELQTLNTALEKATKSQREAMIRRNKPQIESVEKQIREVDAVIEKYQKALTSTKALEDPTQAATIANFEARIAEETAKKAAFQVEIKRLSGLGPKVPQASGEQPPTPTATPTPATPATPVAPPPVAPTVKPPKAAETGAPAITVAANTVKPAPTPVAETTPQETPLVNEAGTNSLGMKFTPVGDVQFSVNLVTRKNFQAFAEGSNYKLEHWKNPGFPQAPDHPVVNVTWKDADAFCKWLTDKERSGGQLKKSEGYRLPTDLEWSKAVGLPAETGATPEDRDMGVADVYPWGTSWPPTEGAGNFAGEETGTEYPIAGYNDKYSNTSPVGAFKPNKAGLYDMGGNVWQWVQDSFDNSGNSKTLRGGSWYNGALKLSLLSSCRIKSSPDQVNYCYGFRIVKAPAGKPAR
jgi:formylglycine-generating enzyme required for sulfatase activity